MNKLVVDEDSVASILTTTLSSLLKASSRKHKELRTELESQQKKLSDEEALINAGGMRIKDEGRADPYYYSLHLAIDTQQAKMQATALDAISRLFAGGYLLGQGKASATLFPSKANTSLNSDGRLLINVIADTLCECAAVRDAPVQLGVIKAVLTGVSSVHAQLHDQALLVCVVALYTIYLQPADDTCKVTAKACLTQLHQLVCARMEHYGLLVRQLESTYTLFVTRQKEKRSGAASTDATANGQSDTGSAATGLASAVSGAKARGRCGVCCVCGSPAEHFCAQTKDPVCSLACKLDNLEARDPSMSSNQQQRAAHAKLLLAYQRDSYLLLRSLLKLAYKPLPTPPDAVAVESKVLSLQLLLSILNHAGPVFRTSAPFIAAVKDDLVKCITRNSVPGTAEPIFSLSSSLFVAIISHFKPHLHAVIGPLLDSIYLPYITSTTASFDQRYISLTVVGKICADPATLVELFLNYDCEMGSLNTFQKISAILEKASHAQPQDANSANGKEEEKQVREVALRALVSCMKVLVHWTSRRALIKQAEAAANTNNVQLSNTTTAPPADDNSDDESAKPDSALSPTAIAGDDRSMTASPPPSAAAATSSSSLDKFQLARQQKIRFENGIFKFNSKPKSGIKYLQEHALIGTTADAVALFFHSQSGLDKTAIGEYMGDEGAFNKQVMYAYVEQMDFRGMLFDEGIRHFVAAFRLPGEAQKIDRMMEKFAEQYHKHNPGVFSAADTAYVLAYSVILLNSDAHNPQVKKRMTKEEFFKNCRGIDDGKDINPVFMGDIYDRITTNEIRMKDSNPTGTGGSDMKRSASSLDAKSKLAASAAGGGVNGSGATNGQAGDAAGGASMNGATDGHSGGSSEHGRLFYLSSDADVDVIQPMFDLLWFPALATFSMILEESDADVWIDLGLDGYRLAVKVSTEMELDTSRQAFVSSLRKFTLLGSSKELKNKNLAAVKVLLTIAHQDGNRLKESWIDVLQCVSEVERLHLAGAARPDGDVFRSPPSASASSSASGRLRESDSVNSLAIHRIDASAIDRVFTGSANLDEKAIIDFVSALRQISEVELSNQQQPRVFALQKIVEITSYNMGRIRLVWNRIWAIISEYFIQAGLHPNLNVSIFAIDSVRQLAMKFLEKDELASFAFQKQFFKPFESIMQHNPSPDTRELIVMSLSRMIASKVHNIKSGWKAVFVVLSVAAKQSQPPLVHAAFDLLLQIMDLYFALITETADTLDECISCLVSFGCNELTDVAEKAIDRLEKVADYLGQLVLQQQQEGQTVGASAVTATSGAAATGRKLSVDTKADHSNSASPHSLPLTPHSSSLAGMGGVQAVTVAAAAAAAGTATSSTTLRVWFFLLTGLSRLVGDSRLSVRSRALDSLFSILNKHGHLFSAATWRHIFHGVLFPIFDDIRHNSDEDMKAALIGGGGRARTNSAATASQPPASAITASTSAGDNTSAATSSSPAASTPPGSTATAAKPPRAPVAANKVGHTSSAAVSGSGSDASWLQSTCYQALFTLVELFHRFQVSVNFLLPELLSLICSCIDGDVDELAKIGLKCLVALCSKCGPELSVQSWWLVLDHAHDTLDRLLPKQLTSNDTRHQLGLQPVSGVGAARKGSRAQPEMLAAGIIAPDSETSTANASTTTTGNDQTAAGSSTATAPLPTADASATTAVTADSTQSPATSTLAVDGAASSSTVPASIASAAPSAPSAAASSATATTAVAPLTLSLTSASIAVRSRTSLLLMDSLCEVALAYFPRRPSESDPLPAIAQPANGSSDLPAFVDILRSPIHTKESIQQQQQQGGGGRFDYASSTSGGESDSGTSSELAESSSLISGSSVSIKRPVDRRVLGRLTCAQLFYCLDILHSSLAFTHTFNADLVLRQKLYGAGLTLFDQPNRLPQLFAAESHALKVSVVLLFTMYKAGIAQTPQDDTEIDRDSVQQPPSFLAADSSATHTAFSASASATSPPYLSVASASLSPSSTAASSAAQRLQDIVDFDRSCWESEQRLFSLVAVCFAVYSAKAKSMQLSALQHSDEVLIAFIEQYATLPSADFLRRLDQVWPHVVDLIEYAQSAPLRAALRSFFKGPVHQTFVLAMKSEGSK